jgi:hypothetical protein
MMDSAVHMGEPPPNYDLQEWNRTSIHFHGFAGLPKERGTMVESDTFTNLGHQWRFVLYAGGDYWNRTSIHFHGFAGLPKERGTMVESDTFTNLGHQWRFVLYAGGDYDAEQGMISVELIHMSVEHIQIACEISVKGPAGPKPRVRKAREFKFDFDPTILQSEITS